MQRQHLSQIPCPVCLFPPPMPYWPLLVASISLQDLQPGIGALRQPAKPSLTRHPAVLGRFLLRYR